MTNKVRYGAGGSIYIEKVDSVKAEEEALKVSYRQSKAAKAEREAMDAETSSDKDEEASKYEKNHRKDCLKVNYSF